MTRRRHELSSMGIRVTEETLRAQIEMAGLRADFALPYFQAIMNDEVPPSFGGGIGQSRVMLRLLRKAHLGEVSVAPWPRVLLDICQAANIPVL